MALGDTVRRCFVLPYSGLCCLWSPRNRKGYDYHAERNHKTLSQYKRLVQDTLHMKTPKKASFTMGQNCPDLWHAICSLELEHDV
jgi:hypothetical protein